MGGLVLPILLSDGSAAFRATALDSRPGKTDAAVGRRGAEITRMLKSRRNLMSGVMLALTLAMGLAAAPEARAQQTIKIWQVPLGTPATQIPMDFVLPACGT